MARIESTGEFMAGVEPQWRKPKDPKK